MPRIGQKPWEFLAVFLLVFFLFSVVLFAVDFVPEPPTSVSADTEVPGVEVVLASELKRDETPVAPQPTAPAYVTSNEAPRRVVIPAVGIDTPVLNPVSTDIKILDNALLKGAVRYPTSALLGENAGVFIFGHQSRLQVTKNPAYRAFAGLHNAQWGDEIIVYSDSAKYRYRVIAVEEAPVDEAWVSFTPGEKTLTLSTCTSFGERTNRVILRADFVSREPLT